MIKNFQKVRKNLYRGAKPSLSDVVSLYNNLHIQRIISLDEKCGKYIEPLCKKLGIEHIIIPLHTNDLNSLKYLFAYDIDQLINEEIPTFVHCLHGADRTGLLIALIRCQLDNWSCRRALKEAKCLKFGVRIDPETENFYIKFIKLACHHNDNTDENQAYDIVSNMNDYTGQYRDYTLDKEEQMSFAPYYGDSRMRKYPESYVDKFFDEQYPTRADYGLEALHPKEDIHENTIPSVGVYDQNTQITNFTGPSLVGTGFV